MFSMLSKKLYYIKMILKPCTVGPVIVGGARTSGVREVGKILSTSNLIICGGNMLIFCLFFKAFQIFFSKINKNNNKKQ